MFPHLQGLSSELTQSPDTLEDLKFVLSAIARIRSMSLEVEIQYRWVGTGHSFMYSMLSVNVRLPS